VRGCPHPPSSGSVVEFTREPRSEDRGRGRKTGRQAGSVQMVAMRGDPRPHADTACSPGPERGWCRPGPRFWWSHERRHQQRSCWSQRIASIPTLGPLRCDHVIFAMWPASCRKGQASRSVGVLVHVPLLPPASLRPTLPRTREPVLVHSTANLNHVVFNRCEYTSQAAVLDLVLPQFVPVGRDFYQGDSGSQCPVLRWVCPPLGR